MKFIPQAVFRFSLSVVIVAAAAFVFDVSDAFGQTCWSGVTWQGPPANPVSLNRTKPVYTACTGVQDIDSNLDIDTSDNTSAGIHITHDGTNRYPALQATLSAGVLVATFGTDTAVSYTNDGYTIRVQDFTNNPEIQLQYSSGDPDDHWSLYADQSDDSFKIWRTSNRLTIYDTPGYLGIGTETPDAALHVVGTDAYDTTPNEEGVLLGYDGSNYGIEIVSPSGASDNPHVDFIADPDAADYDARLVLSGDDELSLDGADFQANDDISIANDLYMIDVKSIRLDDASASTTLLIGNYGVTDTFAYGAAYTANLQVEGDVRANQLCMQGDCKNAWTDITPTEAGGWTDDGAVVRLTTAADDVAIGVSTMSGSGEKLRVYDSGNGGDVRMRLQYSHTGAVNGLRSSVWDFIATSDEGKIQIAQNGTPHFQISDVGNVGISGTLSESDMAQRLTVGESTGANMLIVREDTTTVNNNILGRLLFDSTDGAPSTVDAPAMIAGYAAESHGAGDKGGYMVFATKAINDNSGDAATERMRIEENGWVGIGAEPTATLHVVSAAGTNTDNSPNVPGIQLGNDGSNYAIEITSGDAGDTPYIDFQNEENIDYDMRLRLIGDDQMAFEGGGLSINTATSNGDTLYVNGTGTATLGWTVTSDGRLKKNIHPIQGVLHALQQVQPVYFDWKVDEYPDMQLTTDTQIGFIAQELEQVFPQFVATGSDGYKSVMYDRVSAVLWQAVLEQQEQIKYQDERINELEARIQRLENLFLE